MRALLLGLFLLGTSVLAAQFAIERSFGDPSTAVWHSRLLDLDNGGFLHFYSGPVDAGEWHQYFWRHVDAAGNIVGEGAFGDPLYTFSFGDALLLNGQLYLLLRRRRRNVFHPAPLRLYRLSPEGQVEGSWVLSDSETLRVRRATLQTTRDGGYLLGMVGSNRQFFRLDRLEADFSRRWTRSYSVTDPPAIVTATDHPILLHEYDDGSSLAALRLGNRTGVYLHAADGTLRSGTALDGTLGTPDARRVSSLRSYPGADSVSLIGLYDTPAGHPRPGSWSVHADGRPGTLRVQTAPLLPKQSSGIIRPDTADGYVAALHYPNGLRHHQLDADLNVTHETSLPGYTSIHAQATYLSTTGRVAQVDPANVYLEDRATVVSMTTSGGALRHELVLESGMLNREYGSRIRELPNGELLIGATRETAPGERRIWLLWLDTDGRLLRERTLHGRGTEIIIDLCVDAAGTIYVLTDNNHLLRLTPAGELVWARRQFRDSGIADDHYLHSLSPDSLFFLRAGRLSSIDLTDGRASYLTSPQGSFDLKQWAYFNGQFCLVYMPPGSQPGYLRLRTVSTDGEQQSNMEIPLDPDRRYFIQSMTATVDSLHLLLFGFDPTAISGGGFIPLIAYELVLDHRFDVRRLTPLQASDRRNITAGTGNHTLLQGSRAITLRTDGPPRRYTTTASFLNDAVTLRDGRVAAVGVKRSNLYLGITAPAWTTALPSETLRLAPNPSNGHFRWWLPTADTAPVGWEVVDAAGRTVARGTSTPEGNLHNGTVILRGVNSGTYFLRVVGTTEIFTSPLVIR